jgi:hypothetical protein
MNRLFSMALAGAVLVAAVPVAHAAKGLKPGAVILDPTLGYVLVRIGPTNGKKFKSPALYLWRFDPATNEVRTRRKKDPARVPKGEDDSVVLGDRVFLGGERSSVYIASITPGEWIIHGSYKTCLCLGSYRFTVAPGEITDIGTVLIASEAGGLYVPDLPREPLAPDLEDQGGRRRRRSATRSRGNGNQAGGADPRCSVHQSQQPSLPLLWRHFGEPRRWIAGTGIGRYKSDCRPRNEGCRRKGSGRKAGA